MSDKRKYMFAMLLGAVAFVAGFIFLWWLSGKPFPKERGEDAVFFCVFAFLFGNLGVATVRCEMHDWWWDTLGPCSRKTSNKGGEGRDPAAGSRTSPPHGLTSP